MNVAEVELAVVLLVELEIALFVFADELPVPGTHRVIRQRPVKGFWVIVRLRMVRITFVNYLDSVFSGHGIGFLPTSTICNWSMVITCHGGDH